MLLAEVSQQVQILMRQGERNCYQCNSRVVIVLHDAIGFGLFCVFVHQGTLIERPKKMRDIPLTILPTQGDGSQRPPRRLDVSLSHRHGRVHLCMSSLCASGGFDTRDKRQRI